MLIVIAPVVMLRILRSEGLGDGAGQQVASPVAGRVVERVAP